MKKKIGNLLGWGGTANFSYWNWTTAEPKLWVWAASGLGLPLPGQVLSQVADFSKLGTPFTSCVF